jgi:hypothetical protein
LSSPTIDFQTPLNPGFPEGCGGKRAKRKLSPSHRLAHLSEIYGQGDGQSDELRARYWSHRQSYFTEKSRCLPALLQAGVGPAELYDLRNAEDGLSRAASEATMPMMTDECPQKRSLPHAMVRLIDSEHLPGMLNV